MEEKVAWEAGGDTTETGAQCQGDPEVHGVRPVNSVTASDAYGVMEDKDGELSGEECLAEAEKEVEREQETTGCSVSYLMGRVGVSGKCQRGH